MARTWLTRVRILLLTQWFDPEPALKGRAFAEGLRARGHEVTVVTGFPNYPGGRLYPGYQIRPFSREKAPGLSVLRVALYPSHSASRVGRALNYLSFMVSATIAGMFVARPQAIYAYHPPLTVGLAARIIGIVRRAPVLYDVQDLWPDTIASTGMLRSAWLLRRLDTVARWLYRGMRRVSVLSPGFRAALIQRGVPAERIVYIPNWAPPALDRPVPRRSRCTSGPLQVVFAGNMGVAQDLGIVIDAIGLARDRGALVELVLVGGGVERDALRRRVEGAGIAGVRFQDSVPMSEIAPILAEADILLVHLADDPLFRITVPSKTQAYLAAGRPILMAVGGDAASIVAEAGAGVCAAPGNAHAIADAITALAALSPTERDAMGVRGRRYYEAEMAFDVGLSRFAAALESMRQR